MSVDATIAFRLVPPHALLSALDFVCGLGLGSLVLRAGAVSIVVFGFLDLGSAFVLTPLPRREDPGGTLNAEGSSAPVLLPLSSYVLFTVMLEHLAPSCSTSCSVRMSCTTQHG